MDRLFDFLNSRSPFGKGFKKPLYQNNVERQKEVNLPLIEYLKNRMKRKLIVQNVKKTLMMIT